MSKRLKFLFYRITARGSIIRSSRNWENGAEPKKVSYTLDFTTTPHVLRHTYITNLIASGVDPKTVQYLAGHENSKVTMDIYAKVKYNKPWELAKVVNAAFPEPPKEMDSEL